MSNDAAIPRAPPLPALKSFQRARDAANRIFGYASRPPSPQEARPVAPQLDGRRGSGRLASLGAAQNATASHRTGLEIKTLSINESGTHGLLGGKDIFKTIRVEHGVCVEEVNLRAAIRSTPTQASGKPRQIFNIDIADVAWAKGDTGEFVAAATESGKIIIYDLAHAGLPAAQLHEHYRQVHRITCNPHKGSLLLSGSQDGTVRLWDVRDAKQPVGATRTRSNVQSKSKFAGTTDGVRDVKWSPTDAMDFAFATDGGSVQVWDMRYFNRPKLKIIAHSSTCMSVDWHPDGKHLASAGLDQMIKVWDTGVKPGRKANWEVKTPYPLSNARWRPACEVGSHEEDIDTMRQCTQLLAAYDRSHPALQIWDLRRPALQFRELVPYTEAPTDLLWHSQDLLWTVGRDGTFVQTDIQHSSVKVMERYPVNAAAVSSTGEIASFNMRRDVRPIHRTRRASSSHTPDAALLSRSWVDDCLDDSFLRAHPEIMKQKQRRQHRRQSSDIGISIYPVHARVISLDQVFSQRRAVRPVQSAWRGQLPEAYCKDPLVFEYLAQRSKLRYEGSKDEGVASSEVERLFSHNSDTAKDVGLHRLAARWDVLGYVTLEHLEQRAKLFAAASKSLTADDDRFRPYAAGELAGLARDYLDPGATTSHNGNGSAADPSEAETISANGPHASTIIPSLNADPVDTAIHHTIVATAFGCPPPFTAAHAHAEVEHGSPFELGSMLRDLLTTYTQHLPDAQTAAHLLLATLPCLPITRPLLRHAAAAAVESYTLAYQRASFEANDVPSLLERSLSHIINAGLQPLQLEAILSTYHEQLIAHRCFVEAAALRSLCYPAFPAVYEQAMRDNAVAIMCDGCGTAKDVARCPNCALSSLPCPICQCRESPLKNGKLGGTLWSQCWRCNHGGHAACLRTVLVEEGLSGCPTVGCLCQCSGFAQNASMAQATFRSADEVLQDSMIARESSAVSTLTR